MFFLLSKLLVFVFSPVVWLLALIGAALVARRPERRRQWLRAVLIMSLVLTNPALVNLAWQAWETPLVPMQAVAPGSADVAVLLTGIAAADRPPYDRVFLSTGADRVLHTVQLWRQGCFGRILVTGGSGALGGGAGRSEAEQLRQVLRLSGVPDSVIVVEERARNTRENAVFTAQLLARHPALAPRGRLLLVTSAFHMRRAAGCFRQAGLAVTPFPADFTSEPQRLTPDALLVPLAAGPYHWDRLVHEIVGYLTYRALGYC